MKSIHRLITVIFFPGTLSACGEPEVDIVPVIPHPPPEVQRQAAAGDVAAQFAMADYHLGDENPAVILRWLRASACQGYPITQASLGVLYDAGDGVPQDAFMAYAWWTWAGRRGDPEAAQFADSLYAAMEDDERAFAEALAQEGWAVTPDCRGRSPSGTTRPAKQRPRTPRRHGARLQ